MLLGFARGVTRVSLLGVLSVDLVIQAFGLTISVFIENLNVLLDIAGASVLIVTAFERKVS